MSYKHIFICKCIENEKIFVILQIDSENTMIKRLKTYMTCAALLITLAMSMPVSAAVKGWEVIKEERIDAKSVVRETELEIKSASGVIIINTNHPVQIKVFTILGRIVSSETVPAGRSQLQLPAHGVYIVKVGDLTCKVAV